jgi:hypothetical protein
MAKIQIDYPAEFPLDEIREVGQMLVSGSPDKKVIAKDCWVVCGYGLDKVVGDVPMVARGATVAPDRLSGLTDAQLGQHLLDAVPPSAGKTDGLKAWDWSAVLKIVIPIVIQILTRVV